MTNDDVSAAGLEPRPFFLDWQYARLASRDLKPMGLAGLEQAELVWRHWLAFCTVQGVAWHAAQSAHIQGFLSGIGPRSTLKKTSPVTQRRYWRVLRDFYAYAVVREIMASNPADSVQPAATERVPSLVFSPNMWHALHEGLPSGAAAYKERRNRLVLLLMMRAALTVQEIIALSMASAGLLDGPPDSQAAQIEQAGLLLFQPDSEPQSPAVSAVQAVQASEQPAYLLRVCKARTGRERLLRLDARTSQAMGDWLVLRLTDAALAGPQSRLIVGDRNGKAIAPNGLYNICQAHVARCLVESGLMAAPEPHVVRDPGGLNHLGPNTLRNTCIAMWLNAGVPLPEVQRRCGFKDASVMSRLGAHLARPFPV